MPKYLVTITATDIREKHLEIEAADEQAAYDEGHRIYSDEEINWDRDCTIELSIDTELMIERTENANV